MTPEGWSQSCLGEVADVAIGGTPARNQPAYWDQEKTGANRWVAISDLRGRLVMDTAEYISDLGVRHSNVKLVRAGTTLMSFKLSIGRTALAGRDLYTNEAIAAFLPRGHVDSRYLMYALPRAADEGGNADVAVKGKTLNKAKLIDLPVLLPPLPEQRKIAAILTSVDDAVESTQAVIDQLGVVKRAMMSELLTRGLPGRHTRFKQTEIGEVPEEWKVVPLGTLAAFVTSGSRGWAEHYAESGAVFLRSQNIRQGFLDLSELAHVQPPAGAEGERTRLRPDDILITITGNSVGNVAVMPDGIGPSYVSQHVGLVRLEASHLAAYVALFLSPGSPGNEQVLAAQYGQSKPGLNLTNLRSFLVAMPEDAERPRVQAVLGGVLVRIDAENATLEALIRAKSALMSVLLTGEVRVKPDEDAA